MNLKHAIAISVVACLLQQPLRADLLGYWSADSTSGQGDVLPNDQGNSDLDGELVETSYTADAKGHTGQPGDYAIEFEGFDEDYVVMPPTEEEFEEITITAWVNGLSNGDWSGIVVSRDPGGQPLYLGFRADTMDLAYVWNNDTADSWGWPSEVAVEPEEWNFVALTITEEAATIYSGPKGGELDFNSNEMEHFPQENFHEWRLGEDDCCGNGRNFAGLIDDVSIWNEALSEDQIRELHAGTKTPLTLAGIGGVVGDFDGSGQRDVADLDLLATGMINGDASFDLDGDGDADYEDRRVWVEDLTNTFVGDANFDGQFNSSDFVTVFGAAKYETGQQATWSEGDWNGDKEFDSSDFVVAFSGAGYEKGPRDGGLQVVPEPSGIYLTLISIVAGGTLRRRS
ncbi:MAG: PEP-CTERM sorting domain-containing protein [Planctomycetales bacterium]|nr:PEP-CTERM sorting domain-containing protein [Planctomycetales bacterium]